MVRQIADRVDRPANYDHWRTARPGYWPGPQVGLTAPDPRPLEPLTRTFTPNIRSGPVVADQSRDPGDRELWEFRRAVAREHYMRQKEQHLRAFQNALPADGVELAWPEIRGY